MLTPVAAAKTQTLKRKFVRLALVLFGAAFVSVAAYLIAPSFERAAWPIYDFFQKETALETAPEVALIYITQGSLDELQNNPETAITWPWPREIYGLMARVASQLGAKSLTYDIVFSTPSLYGVDDDRAFNQALRDSKMPIVLVGGDGHHVQYPNADILKDLSSTVRFGVVTVPQEADGVYRRMPSEVNGALPLGYAAVEKPDQHETWLKFYRPGRIPMLEASEVFHLARALEEKRPLSPELEKVSSALKGRHLMVGAAAPGLLDLKPTSVDPYAPGVLVHATALGNALQKISIQKLEPRSLALISGVVSIAAFLVLLLSSTPVPALIGASIVSIVGPFVLAFAAWRMNMWLNPLPILASTGVLSLAVLGVRFQLEWRERERLAKTVSNAMSPDMVELVRRGDMRLTRFGERREISIFFCDLSGFTTISEKLEASVLVDVLNLYLDEVVNLIFDNNGFVDKFIGDAVMALWGAPVEGQTDHAIRAVQSAVRFSETMEQFRSKARALVGDDAEVLTARAGVHTGVAIVGHIGSQSRHNYTAIGDSVNLASRLEGIGKQYDCEVLLSEDVLVAANRLQDPNFLEVDVIAVKGRSKPTRIFTYVAKADELQREAYREALKRYQAADFKAALEKFEQAKDLLPSKKMADRCRLALTAGVPKSFRSGVWHFDEK